MKDKKIDGDQAFEILNYCCHTNQNMNSKVIESIWEELKKQDNVYQLQHYNLLLYIARSRNDSKFAQNIFDELINANIKPNA